MNAVVEFKPRFSALMQEKIDYYKYLRAEIKQLTDKRDQVAKELKDAMKDGRKIYNEFGHVIAEMVKRETENFDKKTFKADHSELYSNYISNTVSYTLSVK